MYKSPKSTFDSSDLLNQTIEDISKLKDELLILGDFNYPNINWEKLYVSHTPEHCASKFSTATLNSLWLLDFTPSYFYRNKLSTKSEIVHIDLIFTSDDQSITNLIYTSPLGKNHHKVLKFSCLIKCSLNQEFQRISYYQ